MFLNFVKRPGALLLFYAAVVPHVSAAQEAPSISVEMVAELKTKLQKNPANADLMRQLAAAQAEASQLKDALATLDRASVLAPADNDIALARARVLLWSGRTSEASAQADIVRTRAPGYPELAEVETAIRAASVHHVGRSGISLSAGVARVDFGSQSQSWESVAMSGFAALGQQKTLTASVEHEARQTSDTRLSLSAVHSAPFYDIRLGLSLTPDADFKEKWGLQTGADYRVHRNVTLISDIRYTRYSALSVVSVVPGIRFQTADASHAIAVHLISIFRSDGDSGAGASARYDGQLGDGLRVFGGAAAYPDTEAGITRQLRSVFAGVALPLFKQISLNLTGEYDRREQSYSRKAVSLGLVFRLNE